MNVVCSLTRYFALNRIRSSFRLHRTLVFQSKSIIWTLKFQKETSHPIHTRARMKLERIHKKNQEVIARSQEALRKLRKKKLEGLSLSTVPQDAQLSEKLSTTKLIRRLLSIYNANKDSKAFTFTNQVITLKRIAELFEKHQEERLQLSKNYFHQKLVCELIDNVMDSCKECTPKELVDVVVSLARLNIKHIPLYAPLIKEIHSHGYENFSAEEIGLLCWTFGITANNEASKSMREISVLLSKKQLVTFSHTALSRIAWSFTELGLPEDGLLKEICTELLSRDLTLFDPRSVTHIGLTFSQVDSLAEHVMNALEEALYAVIEEKKFQTEDLVALTVSFLRCNKISVKMFRKLDRLLISRRDFEETVSKELLEELLTLLKESAFHLAEIRKILENVLYPDKLNSVFDVFFRPRRSWKAKMFKQSWFKVY